MVFAGYGITAPELGYDDYAGIDVTGKVVLIFAHEPQENDEHSVFNGKGNTRYANATYKALNAQRHGAIGILSMTDPNNHAAGAGRGGRGGTTRNRPRIPTEALAEGGPAIPTFTISARDRRGYFRRRRQEGRRTCRPRSTPGRTRCPSKCRICASELHPVLSERRRANSYNVVGLLEGSDPTLRAETVIFSGHFDHDGIGPLGILHGADDNGSRHCRSGGTGAGLRAEPREAEALAAVHRVRCRGARTAGRVLLRGAPAAPARHHARRKSTST